MHNSSAEWPWPAWPLSTAPLKRRALTYLRVREMFPSPHFSPPLTPFCKPPTRRIRHAQFHSFFSVFSLLSFRLLAFATLYMQATQRPFGCRPCLGELLNILYIQSDDRYLLCVKSKTETETKKHKIFID